MKTSTKVLLFGLPALYLWLVRMTVRIATTERPVEKLRQTFRTTWAERRSARAGLAPTEAELSVPAVDPDPADAGTHLREITGRPEPRNVNRGRRHGDSPVEIAV
jgi:hypothetical protein